MYNNLRKKVLEANKSLGTSGLVKFTWGNVSEIDKKNNIIAIKPSGVKYNELKLPDIVVVDLKSKKIYGDLKPSVDLITHIELYKNFPEIGGICHTHSKYATIYCQAQKSIECVGTTHADHFFGSIPITRRLKISELKNNKAYVKNTGKIILETFRKKKISYLNVPGVLVANHAPFTWGEDSFQALKNSIILEEVAEMEFKSFMLNKKIDFSKQLLKMHYKRKFGPKKTYGQK